jgi:Domain of unknown function (DUF2804), N-terminal/Domain of unknown function (DUF2804), C-terminal
MAASTKGSLMRVQEREITSEVFLCLPTGRLNPDAVGWTRVPLHNTDRIGRGSYGWGRNKRWEYWAITTPTHILALTVSSLDFAAVHEVWVFDRATQKSFRASAVGVLSGSVTLPGTLGAGPARATTKDLTIEIDELSNGTRLRASSTSGTTPVSFDVTAERPNGHESLGVVVPWSQRLFQYTVKDVARPAHGSVTVDGREFPVPAGESWAVLDHGRGRWPYSMRWNWGAASGVCDGRELGLQIGGTWTDGTGSTENAILVDGHLHKVSEELVWEYNVDDWLAPWRIHGELADLTFTPFYDKSSAMNLLLVSPNTHQCFGHYSGWVSAEGGERIPVDGLLGWAEAVHNRW